MKKLMVYRMPSDWLDVGNAVIVNEASKPETRNIAIVLNKTDAGICYQHLDERFKNQTPRTTKGSVIPVSVFGIELYVTNGFYWTKKVSDSTASYKDGKPRKWQEKYSMPISQPYKLRPDIYGFCKKYGSSAGEVAIAEISADDPLASILTSGVFPPKLIDDELRKLTPRFFSTIITEMQKRNRTIDDLIFVTLSQVMLALLSQYDAGNFDAEEATRTLNYTKAKFVNMMNFIETVIKDRGIKKHIPDSDALNEMLRQAFENKN